MAALNASSCLETACSEPACRTPITAGATCCAESGIDHIAAALPSRRMNLRRRIVLLAVCRHPLFGGPMIAHSTGAVCMPSTLAATIALCRLLALFGHRAMSDLSPDCAPQRTFASASGLVGCIGVANSLGRSIAPALISSSMDNFEVVVFSWDQPARPAGALSIQDLRRG